MKITVRTKEIAAGVYTVEAESNAEALRLFRSPGKLHKAMDSDKVKQESFHVEIISWRQAG